MWMIPLPDGVMSVGAVCRPDYLKQRRGAPREFLLETLAANPALWQRLAGAELIGNEVRVTGNYSYDSRRMGGPGWVLIGDAFAFLDPVFSSGVYLAMSGAEQAVQMVDAALREPAAEKAPAAAAGAAAARRHGALFVLHLSLQQPGDALAVPQSQQPLAARAERHLDAGRGPVRHAAGAAAPEAVQAGVRASVPCATGAAGAPSSATASRRRARSSSAARLRSTRRKRGASCAGRRRRSHRGSRRSCWPARRVRRSSPPAQLPRAWRRGRAADRQAPPGPSHGSPPARSTPSRARRRKRTPPSAPVPWRATG